LGLRDDIAAMIVTGDFMTHGNFTDQIKVGAIAELNALRAELGLERDQLIAVPGNHDVVRYRGAAIDVRELAVENQTRYEHETGFRIFVEELCDRNWKSSLNYVMNITRRGGSRCLRPQFLHDSCHGLDRNTGYVGKAELIRSRNWEDSLSTGPPTVSGAPPSPSTGGGSRGSEQKRCSLALMPQTYFAGQRAGAQIALHGHQHRPKVSLYQALGLNGEGTSAPSMWSRTEAPVQKMPAFQLTNNTYALSLAGSNDVELWIRELRLNAQAGLEAFHGMLPTPPLEHHCKARRCRQPAGRSSE
jgi:predicted phosphodiesterase